MKKYKIAITNTGYGGLLSIAMLLIRHCQVIVTNVIRKIVTNSRKFVIQDDDYIKGYLKGGVWA